MKSIMTSWKEEERRGNQKLYNIEEQNQQTSTDNGKVIYYTPRKKSTQFHCVFPAAIAKNHPVGPC